MIRQEKLQLIVFDHIRGTESRRLLRLKKFSTTSLAILLRHILQSLDDQVIEALRLTDNVFEIFDLLLKILTVRRPVQDILAVDVTEFDLGYILRLQAVDIKAFHQVRNNIRLQFRIPDDRDRLIDIKQDLGKTIEKMELILLLIHLIDDFPLLAGSSPDYPLRQKLCHTHNTRISVDQDIKVTGERVFQTRETEELRHQCIQICTAFALDADLQAVQVRLITDIVDFLDLARLDQFRDLIDHRFCRSRIRDLCNLDKVIALIGEILRADSDRTAARLIDATHGRFVIENNSSAGEIRCGHDLENIRSRILHIRDRSLTNFLNVKGADIRSHTGGNTLIAVYEDRWIGRRKQDRLLHRAVIVIDEIYGILIQAPEEFLAELLQLDLRISGCRILHIAGILLTEVTLRIHIRMQ